MQLVARPPWGYILVALVESNSRHRQGAGDFWILLWCVLSRAQPQDTAKNNISKIYTAPRRFPLSALGGAVRTYNKTGAR